MRHKLNPVHSPPPPLFENRLNFSLGTQTTYTATFPLSSIGFHPPSLFSRAVVAHPHLGHPLSHLASLCLTVHCFLNYEPHFCQAELDFIFCRYCHLPENASSRGSRMHCTGWFRNTCRYFGGWINGKIK